MKILEQTTTRLRLRDRMIGIWLLALLFVGLCPVMALSGRLKHLQCNRETDSCQLTYSNLQASGVYRFPMEQISQVTVEQYRRKKGQFSYQVVFIVADGRVAISHETSSRGAAEAIANRVNSFLSDPGQPTLSVLEDTRPVMTVMGIVFGTAAALWLLIGCQVTYCDFDKLRGRLRITRWRLIGVEVKDYPWQDLWTAKLDITTTRRGFRRVEKCRIVVFLKSGERIRLTPYYSGRKADKETALTEILKLVGEVPEPTDTDNLTLAGNPAEEISRWQTAIAHNPQDADAYYGLGMAFYRQERLQEAGKCLNRARDLFQDQHRRDRVFEVQEMLWRLEQ